MKNFKIMPLMAAVFLFMGLVMVFAVPADARPHRGGGNHYQKAGWHSVQVSGPGYHFNYNGGPTYPKVVKKRHYNRPVRHVAPYHARAPYPAQYHGHPSWCYCR